MARTHVSCGIALCVALLWPAVVTAGDVFTGYQIDNQGQYYTYLGVRTPLTSSESNLQPFIQVMGAGLGYTFKDNGAKRDAEVQFASRRWESKLFRGHGTSLGLPALSFGGNKRIVQLGAEQTRMMSAYTFKERPSTGMRRERFMASCPTRI